MPTDPVTAIFTIASSVGSAVTASGFAYGIMKEKVGRLETDLKELRVSQKEYVPFHHFEAVIGPMRRTLELVEKDIKEILRVVSGANEGK